MSKPIRVAINGFGRIGRLIFRAYLERDDFFKSIEIVAINDMASVEQRMHLLQYDSVHGMLHLKPEPTEQGFSCRGREVICCFQREPKDLPWKDLNIDLVFECSGFFARRELAMGHVEAGAKKVLISAPAGQDVDATVVYGVNHTVLRAEHTIVSNASCTTNCLATVVDPLHQKIGIESGLMTTIHAATNDQRLGDAYHKDPRRARASIGSMIPTKTGAAQAVGLVLPELAGRLDGIAVRVPTLNVSLVDLTFQAKRDTSVEEINQIFKQQVESDSEGLLQSTELPLVSIDFNHNAASAVVDLTQTKVIGRSVKVLAWYDNEWGFSNRMLDTAMVMMQAS